MGLSNIGIPEDIYNHGLTEGQRRRIRLGWDAYKKIVGLDGTEKQLTNGGCGIYPTKPCRIDEWNEALSIINAGVERKLSDNQIEERILTHFRRSNK